MSASSSKNKEEERIFLILKKASKEGKDINDYFPYILSIHSDLNTIKLKTKTENTISLDIKNF